MTKSKEWREFEKLVARIESVASPHGAVVRSPDHVRDLTTGQMREVDASIRHKLGTAEVLITVECRRRGRKADDTWIEQLATKRQKIGAAKTIAVSAAGFTASAAKSAKHFGIELRTLSEVAASDIENWFLPGGAVHVFRLIEDIRCFVVLYEDSGEPSKYGFFWPDVESPSFYHEEHKSPFPIRDYIPLLELTHPEMFSAVPFDGTKIELEFPIEWRLGDLYVASTDGRLPVHFTKLIAKVSYQSAVCDIESGVHHEYASPEGTVVQHTAFNTELFGLPVTFEHQSDPSGEQKASVKFGSRSGQQRPNKDLRPSAAVETRRRRG
jgi:Restriction endonuclease